MAFWRKRTPETSLVLPAMFTPAYIPGLAWWFDSTGGYAESDIRIIGPNDISGGSWTVINPSAITPVRYTEGAVGNALYGVTQSDATVGNVVPNQPYHIRVRFLPPGGVANARYVAVISGNGAEGAYVDLQNNVVVSVTGGVTNATCVAGVVEYDGVSPGGSNFYATTWDGLFAVVTHVGNGARYFEIVGADIVYTQRKVTNWFNQATEIPFPSVAQAVNARRAVIATDAAGLTPAGHQSFRWSAAADTFMQTAAYVLNQPTTVVTFAKRATFIAGQARLSGNIGADSRVLYAQGNDIRSYNGVVAVGPAQDGNWSMRAGRMNGVNSYIRVGGTTVGPVNSGALGATGLCIGNISGGGGAVAWDGWFSCHAGWYRDLTSPELDLMQAYCATL